MYTPNVFADVIEWFGRQFRDREMPSSCRSTPTTTGGRRWRPPSWRFWPAPTASRARCSATASGPGNLDLVTVALNLFSQGIDPELDFHDIEAVRRVAEHATRMPVHPRHPYVGDLVYTAFSGSHQDAIKKGMDALPEQYDKWEVPYLPIDPKHTGRTYEAIIRVNSQSGKGGVAYVMGTEHGLDLPRRLQIEFSKTVQAVTEASGTEIKPSEIWEVFEKTYLAEDAGLAPRGGRSHDRTGHGRPRDSGDGPAARRRRAPQRRRQRQRPDRRPRQRRWPSSASPSPSLTTTSMR